MFKYVAIALLVLIPVTIVAGFVTNSVAFLDVSVLCSLASVVMLVVYARRSSHRG